MISLKIDPPVIAHRGASAYAPENTLIAFTKAAQLGVKWIEFDVMLGACGEPIIFHDATLERTTNGYGNVGDYPYAYLCSLDAGSWFDLRFAGEPIPNLKKALTFLLTTKMSANIEIKPLPGQARLPQAELSGLRDKAKTISKPGETFTIDNVQFTPSEDEQRQAGNNLRNNLYQQAKAEIDVLNKLYPEQKYYLHQIDFIASPVPMPTMYGAKMMEGTAAPARVAPMPLSIGNKQEMQASVVLAAMPEQVAQKLTHN